MGFFGNLKKIGLINDKISRLEALLEEIRVDFHKRTPQGEIQAKITHGRFILSEIGEIVSSSPKSVFAVASFSSSTLSRRSILALASSPISMRPFRLNWIPD